MHKRKDQMCEVPGCLEESQSLPEILVFLGVSLCSHHGNHLLEVGRAARRTFNEDSFASQAMLREAQSLLYSDAPRNFTLLEGGR